MLREQLGNKRVCLNDDQRRRLAIRAKKLGRRVLHELVTIVTPETLLGWHRKLMAEGMMAANDAAPGPAHTGGDPAGGGSHGH